MKYFKAFWLIVPWICLGINIGLVVAKHNEINLDRNFFLFTVLGAAFGIFGAIGFVLNEMKG